MHLRISGQVQGVSFRYYARQRAHALGLGGWIRNRADGTVEAVVEGPEAAVRMFVDWAHDGPSGAVVKSVHVREEAPEGEREFRIVG
jgi:acylphosphatase